MVEHDIPSDVRPDETPAEDAEHIPPARAWYEKNANGIFSFVCVVVYVAALFLDLALYYGALLPLLLFYALATVVIATVGSWLLTQKGRSTWWLLLAIFPFGWIGLMSIVDQRRS